MCMAIDAAIQIINKVLELKTTVNAQYNIDIFKIHKMLYYAQGLMLAEYDERLFCEPVYADISGPYIGGLDTLYLLTGEKEIVKEIDLPSVYETEGASIALTDNRRRILNFIAEKFGIQERNEVIFETKKQPPYRDTWDKYIRTVGFAEDYSSSLTTVPYSVIPVSSLKEYFTTQPLLKEFETEVMREHLNHLTAMSISYIIN